MANINAVQIDQSAIFDDTIVLDSFGQDFSETSIGIMEIGSQNLSSPSLMTIASADTSNERSMISNRHNAIQLAYRYSGIDSNLRHLETYSDEWIDELHRVDRERHRLRKLNESPRERAARLRARRQLYLNSTHREHQQTRLIRSRVRMIETSTIRSLRLENERRRSARRRSDRLCPDLSGSAFEYDLNKDYASHPSLSIGSLNDNVCQICRARRFKSETSRICCMKGKIMIDPIVQPPDLILSLFSRDHELSRHFMNNIRKYNSLFQMTSFGVSGNIVNEGWMPVFRVQGQIYHRIGSLFPEAGQEPKFLQIYFMGDSNAQIDRRTDIYEGLRRPIILNLQDLLINNNGLIKSFSAAIDRMPTDDHKIIIRSDKTPTNEHSGRFNAPASDEVAIIIVDSEYNRRDIVIHKRNNQLLRIDETHPSYDALQYPLIFWRGNDTYHINLKQTNPTTGLKMHKNMSSMSYYSHQLMIRDDNQNFILKCGNLLNQYVVDMYAKIESERLLYIRLNQAKLRVDSYIHLKDAIVHDGNVADIGQQFILPSSFTGSPRHMHEYAQDAMAYVRHYGRPDLFITFTCNPKWKEITRELKEHESVSDRNDIVARVFRQKLLKLMNCLTKYNIFYPTKCHMYSVEWQKRGLPHAHILLWLRERIRPDRIDLIISAELPNPDSDPVLFETVRKSMVHGPCGKLYPNSPCMVNGRCSKGFPKPYMTETQTGEDGYPLYQRRKPSEGGLTFNLSNGCTIDNSWIVPYSPILCKMFDAHINVEYCNSVKSIKYICKYIHKGSDMAMFELDSKNNHDEIKLYQLGRYISTNEAFWRIFCFPIHDRNPSVLRLDIHLENGQRVYFNADNAIERAENPPATTLTGFFDLCKTDSFARTLLYTEIGSYYVWNQARRCFTKRLLGSSIVNSNFKETDTISRIYSVHPSNSECFFLRILLTKIRGPSCFADLKTVDGVEYPTYREACQIRGLLESDDHWKSTLEEAASTKMPSALRKLFCVIICECNPSNPLDLWEKFKEDLSLDILNQHRRIESTNISTGFIFNQALIFIEDICFGMKGKRNVELGLPQPERHINFCNPEIVREMNYNTDDLFRYVSINAPLLVPDQKIAYDSIMQSIMSEQGRMFFLDAPGGTGKTFLLNLILATGRQQGKIILAVASSGIAATLLTGGRTAHSTFKIPLDLSKTETPSCSISRGTNRAELLNSCSAIIWDECTMSHKKSFEAVERLLRDIRKSDKIMGGVTLIFAGDFRQTLPVIKRSTAADELNACLKSSSLWNHVQRLSLTTNMRIQLRGDIVAKNFASQLIQIGDGTIPYERTDYTIRLPTDFCFLINNQRQLIDHVYPNIALKYTDPEWLCERAILAPTNEIVDELNSVIQDLIPSRQVRDYLSIDRTVDPDQAVNYPIEFLNSLKPPGFPHHVLTLKIGSPIMLIRNLDPPRLCNGTRLVITDLKPNIIAATILAGPNKGETAFIPRIPLISSDLVLDFQRLQFPIKLCYAITINKSQGQSMQVVGVDLTDPCFSHGQLYVACSRVGTPSNLYILNKDGRTKNVVYKQALI